MFDIEKTKNYLIEICDANRNFTLDQKKSADYWWYKKDQTVYLDRDSLNKFFDILTEIREITSIKNNFHKEKIKETIQDILSDALKESKEDQAVFIENELIKINSEFKSEIKNWTFLVPLFNLNMERNFSVGDVEFFKFDENVVSEVFEELDKEEPFYKFYIKPNIGLIYAKASALGAETTAYNMALYKIRLAINIIKFFVDPSFFQFGLIGELPKPEYRTIFYHDDNDNQIGNKQLVGRPPDFRIDNQFIENPFFREIDRILKDPNSSAFEKRLLIAVYWYGESINVQYDEKERIYERRDEEHDNLEYFKIGEGMIKLFTSLESVLLKDNEGNKKRNLSKRGSKLLSETEPQQIKYYEPNLKFLYYIRGKIVHNGNNSALANEFTELNNYVNRILCHLIILNKKYKFKSVKRLVKYLDNSSITPINNDLNETFSKNMI